MDEDEYQKKAKLIVDEVLKNSLNQVRKEREESESLREEMDIEAIVELTIEHSMTAVRDGNTSPTDKIMSQMAKQLNIKEEVPTLQTIMMKADGKPEWVEKPDGAIPNADNPKKTKKNIFERLLDSILGCSSGHMSSTEKQEEYEDQCCCDENVIALYDPRLETVSGGHDHQKHSKRLTDGSSGVTNEDKSQTKTRKTKRGWFRKNVFLCCLKNTATVEPMDD